MDDLLFDILKEKAYYKGDNISKNSIFFKYVSASSRNTITHLLEQCQDEHEIAKVEPFVYKLVDTLTSLHKDNQEDE